MHVAFLYNRATEDPAHFAEDDDPSRSPVVAALERLGHDVTSIDCTLDLEGVRDALECHAPDVVFNRVESLGGSDALAAAVAMLLDAMQMPYTGCPMEALVTTASKIGTKERLIRAGLPTPGWITGNCGFPAAAGNLLADCGLKQPSNPQFGSSSSAGAGNPKYILKSVFEHASFEMDDASVIGPAPLEDVAEQVRVRSAHARKPFFAERFIDGREFNLSLLGDEPIVLPPAEIDFSMFPATKPRIVGFGAKWDDSSFEFHHTPRTFDFPAGDAPLLRRLSNLAVECWRLFGLRGYARVDFRVDTDGQPWILEVNTNPCLAPTSGFAAAVGRSGMSYDEGIQRIVDAANRFECGSSVHHAVETGRGL